MKNRFVKIEDFKKLENDVTKLLKALKEVKEQNETLLKVLEELGKPQQKGD